MLIDRNARRVSLRVSTSVLLLATSQANFQKWNNASFLPPRSAPPPPQAPARTRRPQNVRVAQQSILILGDEILAGKVVDSNASWLSQLLHRRGVDLCRVEIVGGVYVRNRLRSRGKTNLQA